MVWRGLLIVMLAGLLGGCGDGRAEAPAPAAMPSTAPPMTPAQRTCPVCKQPVAAEAKYCRACGSRQP